MAEYELDDVEVLGVDDQSIFLDVARDVVAATAGFSGWAARGPARRPSGPWTSSRRTSC